MSVAHAIAQSAEINFPPRATPIESTSATNARARSDAARSWAITRSLRSVTELRGVMSVDDMAVLMCSPFDDGSAGCYIGAVQSNPMKPLSKALPPTGTALFAFDRYSLNNLAGFLLRSVCANASNVPGKNSSFGP